MEHNSDPIASQEDIVAQSMVISQHDFYSSEPVLNTYTPSFVTELEAELKKLHPLTNLYKTPITTAHFQETRELLPQRRLVISLASPVYQPNVVSLLRTFGRLDSIKETNEI